MMTRRRRTWPKRSDYRHWPLASRAQKRRIRKPTARCPICGTRVAPDDALGVLDGAPAHAECALVHWLRTSIPGTQQAEPRASRHDSGSETVAFIEVVERLCGDERELDS